MAPEIKTSSYKIDWEKCIVYSLGMLFLELSSLEKISKFDIMEEKQIYEYINENLDSIFMREIIHKMTKEDPNKRPFFNELIEKKKINKLVFSGEEIFFFEFIKKMREISESKNEEINSIGILEVFLK